MNNPVQISVVVITYNEEKNILRCLQSVQDIADEIIVIDSGSTDKTKEIVLKTGAKFIHQNFLGYVEQKNFANQSASNNIILSLDADEELSETLKNSILKVKENWVYDGYEFNRLTNYCGHWVKHSGWYPDRKIRLFDRNKSKWIGEMIHEELSLINPKNKIRLNGDLLHYSYYTEQDHINQIQNFTDIQAKIIYKSGNKPNLFHFYIKPAFKFFRDYILKTGFLDGKYGLRIAKHSAEAVFIKYKKAEELFKNV